MIYVRECFAYILRLLWCYVFKSLSHFGFTFVHGESMCYNLIDLHVAVQLFQHHCWRDCLFSIVYCCLLCQRLTAYRCMGLFLSSLFCAIDPYVCFYAIIMMFWLLQTCSVVQHLGGLCPWLLFFFLNIAVVVLSLLWIHTKFRIILVPWKTSWVIW